MYDKEFTIGDLVQCTHNRKVTGIVLDVMELHLIILSYHEDYPQDSAVEKAYKYDAKVKAGNSLHRQGRD